MPIKAFCGFFVLKPDERRGGIGILSPYLPITPKIRHCDKIGRYSVQGKGAFGELIQ
jgi:hypothetical protein